MLITTPTTPASRMRRVLLASLALTMLLSSPALAAYSLSRVTTADGSEVTVRGTGSEDRYYGYVRNYWGPWHQSCTNAATLRQTTRFYFTNVTSGHVTFSKISVTLTNNGKRNIYVEGIDMLNANGGVEARANYWKTMAPGSTKTLTIKPGQVDVTGKITPYVRVFATPSARSSDHAACFARNVFFHEVEKR